MMKFFNLGILAHVDAGKTSLTERLLFNAGVIDRIGSVDTGDTQTDSLDLERQRGITIKTAAVSYTLGNTTVNLLDTPGHPDFIAEVERVLTVLDGAILVISAVEGVQAQTRILMRALHRLKIPTIIFINKIDRRGARYNDLLNDIAQKLMIAITPMGTVSNIGTPNADFISQEICEVRAENCPVFAGSAITGAGIPTFAVQITQRVPATMGHANNPLSGTIFKINRGPSGERIAYIRMFAGTLKTRDILEFGKITAISVFDRGAIRRSNTIVAGQIGILGGLSSIRVGDAVGMSQSNTENYFARPMLETVITPRKATDRSLLFAALTQLAEQDPLINLRQVDVSQALSVSLYGEVQKEIIQATLLSDFELEVDFERTTTLCVERPKGVGQAIEFGKQHTPPFLATVGLRIEPASVNCGLQFRIARSVLGTMPLAFFKAIEDTVHKTLRQGLYGWQVTDCIVTLIHAGYFPRQSHSHARFDKSMSSTGADFRSLTPFVLMDALKQAGTVVHEPLQKFEMEIPVDALRSLLPVLVKHDATVKNVEAHGLIYQLTGSIPTAQVHQLQQQLPALTSGEGVLECIFDQYVPVRGKLPTRART
jgi:ribosomal protection tetracycline resistance protein